MCRLSGHGGQAAEKQAGLATLYSMLGMLVYLWFRFQLIYGVAAVVACFHDTLITVGFFASPAGDQPDRHCGILTLVATR